MTKFYQAFSTLVVILLLAACSKDDPLPAPVPNFFTDPDVVEVGVPVMFDNLSTNAARYEWIFGDSSNISTEISPTVTFENAGTVTVTLRAFTEDDQMVESSKDVRVMERVLTGYFISFFPTTNGTDPWDPGEAGDEQFPDIFVILAPTADPASDNSMIQGIFGNLGGAFGNAVDPSSNRVVLTDEDWDFRLFDFDGDPDNIDLQESEGVAGVTFNPVQAPTIKNSEGDAGFVNILLVDNTTNEVFEIDFNFELQ
ncbi:MAG: PKD domain-containing protein [Cyclobacteriaceae bacterium]